MQIAGIVAEYNPFHNGHAYQIEQTRKMGVTHIVAIMSGNYLQRGEAALLNKFFRAQAALRCGVDLVLELPLPRALATAEYFAYGALSLMRALGCIDMVSFGAEHRLEELQPLAKALVGPAFRNAVRKHLQAGLPFAHTRQLAVEDLLGKQAASPLRSPNSILAVEYLKAAQALDFSPTFLAIRRQGALHDSCHTYGKFASASHLRQLCLARGLSALSPYVPPAAYTIYQQAAQEGMLPAQPWRIELAMLAVLRRLSQQDLSGLPDLSEGLEHRLYSAIQQAVSLSDLYDIVKCKRYSHARIRRLAFAAWLGLTQADADAPLPYLRVLGLTSRGAQILSRAKETARLPFSTSLAQLARKNETCARFAALEARSTDLYSLLSPKRLPCGLDYTHKPIVFLE